MRSGKVRKRHELEERSLRALEASDFETALELLESLAALDPGDASVPKKLARIYQDLGRPREALSALVRAADAYVAAGAGIQAIALCKWILELDPLHTSTLERLAELRDAGGADARVARAPRTGAAGRASKDASAAPLEEVMLTKVVEPNAPTRAEGVREILGLDGFDGPDDDDIDAAFDAMAQSGDDGIDAPIDAPIDEFEEELDEQLPPAVAGEHTSPELPRPDAATAQLDDEQRRVAARRLVGTPLFGRLGARALRRLIDAARLLELAEGEVLFRQGDPADALYVVAEGAVVPIAEGETRRKLSVLEAGEFLGEIALVADQPRNATVEALVDTTLLAIDRSVFRAMLDEEPEMLAASLRFLRQRLVDRLFRTSSIFTPLDRKARAQVARCFRLMEVQAETCLIEQGRPARALHVVLAGELRVVRASPAADEAPKQLAVLGAGDPCGEMSLLDDEPAVASVIAARRSWVLLLPRADFDGVLESHPALRATLTAVVRTRRSAESDAFVELDASDLELV